jgi:uncharacterized protein
MDLKNKRVLITGSGRGLGKATALLLGKYGLRVVVSARTESEIIEVANQIKKSGGDAIAIPCDITDTDSVKKLFENIEDVYGGIDILINNAGIGIFKSIENLESEEVEQMLSVNLLGTFNCSKEALKKMKQEKQGHIINVISTAGKKGKENESGYCASKWGVVGFTECLRLEGKPFGIRVTSFIQGGMDTSFWSSEENKKYQPQSNCFMKPDYVAKQLLKVINAKNNMDEVVIKRK